MNALKQRKGNMPAHRIGLLGLAGSLAILLAFVIAVTGAGVASAHPAVAATVSNKITLNESSIDGPALWSQANGTPQSGSPTIKSILGWAGTDASHHLNVETSQDGLHYGNKITLNEESFAKPAVQPVSGVGPIIIAWAGIDTAHSLNVLYNVYGSRYKLTLHESSISSPTLAPGFGGNDIVLGWTGTDVGHHLNVLPITIHQGASVPLTLGTKTILYQYSSDHGPDLVYDTHNNGQLLLTWTYRTSDSNAPERINYAMSANGVGWSTPLAAPTPQTSIATPAMLAINYQPAAPYWWAWTGTDAAHTLNVTNTSGSSFPNWPKPITPLNEQALGAPALGYTDNGSSSVLLAWTGVDPQHHLNIAYVTA